MNVTSVHVTDFDLVPFIQVIKHFRVKNESSVENSYFANS